MKRNGVVGLFGLLIYISCLVFESAGYCWQAGYNPGFTGPPKLEQVSIDTVRVSWDGIVKHRDCADQFLVKFWPRSSPQQYATSDLVPPNVDFIDLKVTPKISYQFQAVAREDKGLIGGIDWNKSPVTDFKTSTYNTEVEKSEKGVSELQYNTNSGMKPGVVNADAIRESNLNTIYHGDEIIQVAGMSLFLLVGVVIASLLAIVIFIGVMYKCFCVKKKDYDIDVEIEEKVDAAESDNEDEKDSHEKDSLSPEKNQA